MWFSVGGLPAIRTLGSAVLSVILVGMGVSLGRDGAPKQTGAVFGNWMADGAKLSVEQRRLLVAFGVGVGMAAAYGVPLGDALFSLEVLRGITALMASSKHGGLNRRVDGRAERAALQFPDYEMTVLVVMWSFLMAPVAGFVSVGYVRAIAWADWHKPKGWKRSVAPLIVMGFFGAVSFRFPQILGNGQPISELTLKGEVGA